MSRLVQAAVMDASAIALDALRTVCIELGGTVVVPAYNVTPQGILEFNRALAPHGMIARRPIQLFIFGNGSATTALEISALEGGK